MRDSSSGPAGRPDVGRRAEHDDGHVAPTPPVLRPPPGSSGGDGTAAGHALGAPYGMAVTQGNHPQGSLPSPERRRPVVPSPRPGGSADDLSGGDARRAPPVDAGPRAGDPRSAARPDAAPGRAESVHARAVDGSRRSGGERRASGDGGRAATASERRRRTSGDGERAATADERRRPTSDERRTQEPGVGRRAPGAGADGEQRVTRARPDAPVSGRRRPHPGALVPPGGMLPSTDGYPSGVRCTEGAPMPTAPRTP